MWVNTKRIYDEYGNVVAIQYVYNQSTNNSNLTDLNKYYLITQTLDVSNLKHETKPEVKEEPKKEIKPEVKEEPKKEIKPEVKEEPKKKIKEETNKEIKLKFVCNTNIKEAFEYLHKGNYIITYNDLYSYLIKVNKLEVNDLIVLDTKNSKNVYFDNMFVEIVPKYSIALPYLDVTEYHSQYENWSVWMLEA